MLDFYCFFEHVERVATAMPVGAIAHRRPPQPTTEAWPE
jgi:hypothetical protein